jgi:uncharacterized MAPEG superfamily protein
MTIAYWCVLAAALLPFAFTGAAKFGGERRYNNRKPREYLDQLEGWRKRAHWVQVNSFEAFPAFAAAVIIAHLAGAAQGAIDGLAVAFIALRVIYGLCYIFDKHVLRSTVWMVGMGCVIALFAVAA